MESTTYLDEEEILGFPVWAAELEAFLGMAKHSDSGVDQVQLYELLQKMLMSIGHTDRNQIRRHQETTMVALTTALTQPSAAPIRRLMAAILAKLLESGGSVHQTVSSFVQFLSMKEIRQQSDSAITAALEALSRILLCHAKGTPSVVASALETVAKFAKGFSSKVRSAALHCCASAVLGLGFEARDATTIQDIALRAAEKGYGSKREIVRYAAAHVISAVGRSGGLGFWNGWVSSCVRMCVQGLQDASDRSRSVFAQALGELAACPYHPVAKELVDQQPNEHKKQQLAKQMTELVKTSLIDSMARAISEQDERMMSAVSQGWLAFLTAIKTRFNVSDSVLAELGMSLVGALGEAKGPKGSKKEDTRQIEFPHAQASLLYTIKFGVVDQMSESGQRYLLENLGSLLATEQQENLKDQRMVQTIVPACQHVLVLQVMELLLEMLEEVPTDSRQGLEGPVTELMMRTPNASLRHQCAMTLARLALADRAQAPFTLSKAIDDLKAASEKLYQVGMQLRAQSESLLNKIQTLGITIIKEKELAEIKPLKAAVEARSLALAAMVSYLRQLPLGLSSQLYRDVLKLVEHLIMRTAVSSKDPPDIGRLAGNILREGGYLVGAALLASISWSAIGRANEPTPLYLWRPALNPDSVKLFESSVKSFVILPLGPGANSDLIRSEMRWRANALEALAAWVNGPHASRSDQEASTTFTVPMLQMVLNIVPQYSVLMDPRSQRFKDEDLFCAAVRFQASLMDAFDGLPDPAAYQGCHKQLLQICFNSWQVTPLDPAMPAHRLRDLLDRSDDVLGPWFTGRDPMGDQLNRFKGQRGGMLPRPWNRESLTTRVTEPLAYEEHMLQTQIKLTAKIFPYLVEKEQFMWIDKFQSHVKTAARDKDRPRRADIMCSVAYALLSLLKAQSMRLRAGQSLPNLAARVFGIAQLMSEGCEDNAAVLRGAAEVVAYAARIGTEEQALQVVHEACSRLTVAMAAKKEKFDLPRPIKAYLSLVVGCIYRKVSGNFLMGELMSSIRTLVDVTKRLLPDSELTGTESTASSAPHLWCLHALCLSAANAGPAFLPLVFTTLSLGYQLLLSDNHLCSGMTAALARIANAAVTVLGPEIQPGSNEYNYTKALIREVDLPISTPVIPGVLLEVDGSVGVVAPAAGEGGGEGTQSSLETVLYAQQLVLFAPQAVPLRKHIQMLTNRLRSGQPYLRRAAAKMLRLISERETAAVMDQQVELNLFAALDTETEPTIAAMLKDTLAEMMRDGCATQPAKWLTILGEVALGTPVPEVLARRDLFGHKAAAGADGDAEEEDDEGGAGGESVLTKKELHTAPQLRTRVFAAEMLLDFFSRLGSLPQERVREILAHSLQGMVNLGYKLVTGNVEALRTFGLQFLLEVVGSFGDVEDPDYPGHRLLEQYQAQMVSSLRYGLSADHNPVLMALGARLTTAFLEFGLSAGDLGVVSRLMTMLIAPVKNWSRLVEERMQAETLSALLKVSLLEAHASCAHFALKQEEAERSQAERAEDKDGKAADANAIFQAQQPYETKLLELWLGLLSDLAAVLSLPESALGSYNPSLFSVPAPAILLAVQPFLEAAAPTILEGTTDFLRRKALKIALVNPDAKLVQPFTADLTRYLDILKLLCCFAANPPTPAEIEALANPSATLRGANLLVRTGFAGAHSKGLLLTTILKALSNLVAPELLARRLIKQSQALDVVSFLRDAVESLCQRTRDAQGKPTEAELASLTERAIIISSRGLLALAENAPAEWGAANAPPSAEDGAVEASFPSVLGAAVCATLVAASRHGVTAAVPNLIKSCTAMLHRAMPDDVAARVKPVLLSTMVDLLQAGRPADGAEDRSVSSSPAVLAVLAQALTRSTLALCDDLSRNFLRRMADGQAALHCAPNGPEAWLAATVVSLTQVARREAVVAAAPHVDFVGVVADGPPPSRLSTCLAVLASLSLTLAATAQDIRSYQQMTSFGADFGDDGGFDAFGEGAPAAPAKQDAAPPENESDRLALLQQCMQRLQLTELSASDALEGGRLLCIGCIAGLLDPAGTRNGKEPAPARELGWVQSSAVRAVWQALPAAQDASPQAARWRGTWAQDLFSVYLPHMAHAVHEHVTMPSAHPLALWPSMLAVEAARLVHAAVAGLPEQHSHVLRMAQVAVPLMITAAAPPYRPYSPPLLDQIVKFLTRLAKEHGDVFKQTIDTLNADAKQLLQSVLKSATTGTAPALASAKTPAAASAGAAGALHGAGAMHIGLRPPGMHGHVHGVRTAAHTTAGHGGLAPLPSAPGAIKAIRPIGAPKH